MPSDSARQNATARGIEPGIDPFLPLMGDTEQFRAPKLRKTQLTGAASHKVFESRSYNSNATPVPKVEASLRLAP